MKRRRKGLSQSECTYAGSNSAQIVPLLTHDRPTLITMGRGLPRLVHLADTPIPQLIQAADDHLEFVDDPDSKEEMLSKLTDEKRQETIRKYVISIA